MTATIRPVMTTALLPHRIRATPVMGDGLTVELFLGTHIVEGTFDELRAIGDAIWKALEDMPAPREVPLPRKTGAA